ncbi:MAG: RsmD family RNA methyltransferase [Longimicrobiales bacterium]
MRVKRGKLAGRDLMSPGARVRSTSEAVRDHWLTALGDRLEGARVLDLFAGSGALGVEALSRGAARADFVENGAASLHALKANVAAFRLKKRARIFKRDAIPFVEGLEADTYDITFADPPYGSRKLDRVIARWMDVRFSQVLSVEHRADHEVPATGVTRDYGQTRVTIFGL